METKGLPQFTDVFKELDIPEWLNGKEISFLELSIGNNDLNNLMETCRCFQSLYAVICSARFNLSCACRSEYPELLDVNNPQLSVVWMRSQFVNNAILWYKSAFDLALQPLWMYYKIYSIAKPNLKLTTDNLNSILQSCRINLLIRYGKGKIADDILSKLDCLDKMMEGNIRMWANILKHRKSIEYIELSQKDHPFGVGGRFTIEKDENGKTKINIFQSEYDSTKTVERISMSEVINQLFLFHKEFIPITKDINDLIFSY